METIYASLPFIFLVLLAIWLPIKSLIAFYNDPNTKAILLLAEKIKSASSFEYSGSIHTGEFARICVTYRTTNITLKIWNSTITKPYIDDVIVAGNYLKISENQKNLLTRKLRKLIDKRPNTNETSVMKIVESI